MYDPTYQHRLAALHAISFAAAVLLLLPGKTLTVQLVDIALKGALVASNSTLDVVMQTKCRLASLMSEGGDGLVLTGKLVHLDAAPGQHPGKALGVRASRPPPDNAAIRVLRGAGRE